MFISRVQTLFLNKNNNTATVFSNYIKHRSKAENGDLSFTSTKLFLSLFVTLLIIQIISYGSSSSSPFLGKKYALFLSYSNFDIPSILKVTS